MIILDTVNRSLEIVLEAAIVTNQLPCVVSYTDHDQTTWVLTTAASTTTVTNSTTPVTVVAAPSSGISRKIKYLSVYNYDTTNATVTVQFNDNTTLREVVTFSLIPGQTLIYTEDQGFSIVPKLNAVFNSGELIPIDQGTKSSGTFTPEPYDGAIQHIINGGAFTLNPPISVGAFLLYVTNNSSAGTITVGSFDATLGDVFNTVDAEVFECSITNSGTYTSIHIINLTGGSTSTFNPSSPPEIGDVTPNTGAFTTLTANTAIVGTQANKATLSYTTNTARTLTIPNVSGDRTFSFINQAETFSAVKTFSANPILSANSAELSFSSATGNKRISTGGTTNLDLAPGSGYTSNIGRSSDDLSIIRFMNNANTSVHGQLQFSNTTYIYVDPNNVNANSNLRFNIDGSDYLTLYPNYFQVGTSAPVTDSRMSVVQAGNSIEFGHTNSAGYRSTLGAESSSGFGFLALHGEAGTSANTYRTRGVRASVIRGGAGSLAFCSVANTTADNQTLDIHGYIDTAGRWVFGGTDGGGYTTRLQVHYLGGGSEYGIEFRPDTDTTNVQMFQNAAGSNVGFISITSTTTTYNTTSDYRLKTDDTPLSGVDALTKVMSIEPVEFIWKSTGMPDVGFIAHKLQEVVQQAVTGDKDGVDINGNILPQGVDSSKLVPWLVAAMQEQQSQIESLTEQLNTILQSLQ